ncbi:Titin, partial [Eumeta japonica]
ISQVHLETGDVKTVKKTKKILKKKKGPKEEITEITTIQQDDEQPITTITVKEEDVRRKNSRPPKSLNCQKSRKRTLEGKRKKSQTYTEKKEGPVIETTQIITEQEDDKQPTVTIHKTQELTDETITTFEDTYKTDEATIVEEVPETVQISQVHTETGDVKTVKKTKKILKKKKGPKEEITEITTIQRDDEQPITTITVKEEDVPEEKPETTEIVELPEEVEETQTPEGKRKKITKRTLKKKEGPVIETTQIITEQEDDKQPTVTIHKTQELTDETITTFEDTYKPDKATVVEEVPETVQISQVHTETGDVKTVKKTKKILKKKKGPKEEITEITTIQQDDEQPITTITVKEEDVPEEKPETTEVVELPEEVEETRTPEGKRKKVTKRTLKKKEGPVIETTQIITEQEDDKQPTITIHKTQELTDETITTFEDTYKTDEATIVEEVPETVQISQVHTETGDVKTVKKTKKILKKKKGPKEEITEITTIQQDDEQPITTITVKEEDVPEEKLETTEIVELRRKNKENKKKKGPKEEITEITTIQQDDEQPITTITVKEEDVPEEKLETTEIVELPEEVEETRTPEGKRKKVIKRTLKKKEGPVIETTQIITEQEDDKQPTITIHKTQELTDETTTTFQDTYKSDKATVVEEVPETVQISQVHTETGDVKTVKKTKKILKKKKGPKEEITEITTIQQDNEQPITTITVSVKKYTEKKEGPVIETTQIITEQEDDKQPTITIHKTQELTDETTTTFQDTYKSDKATVVEEVPETVQISQVHTETGDVKTVKKTKKILKKKKGPKEEITEITTIQQDDEQPITTITVKEEDVPEEKPETTEIVELPEEVEETQTPEGKRKKITKRTLKKKEGPVIETTQIITEQEDDKQPTVTIHKTQELTDETITTFENTYKPDKATVVEEVPETVQISEVHTETGDVKTVKKTKKILKKKKGPKEEVTEITTIQQDDEQPITTITVKEEDVPEEKPETTEIVELPEEVEETQTPEAIVVEEVPETVQISQVHTETGDVKTVKKTKKILKKKKGPKEEITEITTIQQDDEEPITTITVKEEDVPEEKTEATEVVELPEEVEETRTPEGKRKKVIKRTLKKKEGPVIETTQIITEQEDDKQPTITIHKTQELTDETTTTFQDTYKSDKATVVEEVPETVQISQVHTETGDVKTIKKIKKILKKKKGPREEITEITTIQQDDEQPITTITVKEEDVPEEKPETTEVVELPEEVEETRTPEGKRKKVTKRTLKKKEGPVIETTQIITEQEDDKQPTVTIHKTQELTDETTTTFEDTFKTDKAIVVEEVPETVQISQVHTETGDVKTIKKIKKILKKKKGPKEEITEITTIQQDDEQPITTITVKEEDVLDEKPETTEVVELPEEVEETRTPEGKRKKVTKRTLKKKEGPIIETTQIITEQEDDKQPTVTIHKTQELTDETITTFENTYKPDKATVVEEVPETVQISQVQTETGDVKTVKKIKKILKKKKGPKEEITEITTIQQDDEQPITTITVKEEDVPEEKPETTDVVELPEEVEETRTPEGKRKKVTKRTLKKKEGPVIETTQIITEQEDDKQPTVTIHKTQELTDETTTTFEDTFKTDKAIVVEEVPETVQISQVHTETGDVKTVKKTKKILKKKKGPREEITEITTIQQDNEQPITTITVKEEDVPEEKPQTTEVVELPEEVEETRTPEGKRKKVTKRTLKKKEGPIIETTQIITEQEDDKQPTVTIHKTQELTDETTTTFQDTYKTDKAIVVEEVPETVQISQVHTETGDVKTVKKTKKILKKKKGPKEEITEITTIQQDDEEPITTITVKEEDVPEEKPSHQKSLNCRRKTTQIITEQEDDKQPTVTIHKTQELTDETTTTFEDTFKTDKAIVVEEVPETVQISQVHTETGHVKTIKKTKKILKKKKGPKEEITEITTIQQDDEQPITTITVKEEDVPEEKPETTEIVELPEEVEETQTPEGKRKKITKRTLKKKEGPIIETTQIITEQEDDKQPTVTIHKTQELTDETTTTFQDTYKTDEAIVVEEVPETVQISQVHTETGDVKTVKKTKKILKKKKGPKEEITEITTIQQDNEQPITTVTVTEENIPEEKTETTEVVELPEEVEETRTPEGKRKKVTKRTLKKKEGPVIETTQIITEQEDDKQPTVTIHKTQELTDETTTTFKDTYETDKATVLEEVPGTVQISQVHTETGDVKTVKKTKKILKKKKGPKEEITEITTIQQDDEQPITTITVTEEDVPEEKPETTEVVELPEEVEETRTPEGKRKKVTKRTLKKKEGPVIETTQIITEQEDDKQPTVTIHKTQELTDETSTTFEDIFKTDKATAVEEVPETVQISQVHTETGDVKTVKKIKKILKKKKGPKEEITEITTIQQDDEQPITTITVKEEDVPEEKPETTEVVELPEEVEETRTPEGKRKKVTKRTLKKKEGPIIETTQIITEQEDDKQPTVTIHKTQELTDKTTTTFEDIFKPDKATVVEEMPETVQISQVHKETGEVQTIRKTKKILKKKKGPKEEITEITTIQQDDEQPITTITVTEEDVPEEKPQTTEIVELPEEVEETRTPEGERKKVTKRLPKKKGPIIETTQIITEQVDDEQPTVTIHKTQELTDETTTTFEDIFKPDKATAVEEVPETVQISQVHTETGDVKTVKKTKQILKKKKGPKEEITEITTIQQDDEQPITTITVTEKDVTEEKTEPTEIVELPEEVEETRTSEGKLKKVTKRLLKKKEGPIIETTQIITEQEDDKQPTVTIHKTQELTDETTTTFEDIFKPDKATVVEEMPETVQVSQVHTKTRDVQTVRKTKKIFKKTEGPKEKIKEITTVQQDDEQPIKSVTVIKEDAPEETSSVEFIELPEEVEETQTPEGKTKKVTKRVLKQKKGPITETTQIVTEQVEDKQPTITVQKHKTDRNSHRIQRHLQADTATLVQRLLEITEITTLQQDDEEPITTVTVTEEDAPEVSSVEFTELPEEVEETKTPEGKAKTVTKRVLKQKKGPLRKNTNRNRTGGKQTAHYHSTKTQEITDETVTEFKDTYSLIQRRSYKRLLKPYTLLKSKPKLFNKTTKSRSRRSVTEKTLRSSLRSSSSNYQEVEETKTPEEQVEDKQPTITVQKTQEITDETVTEFKDTYKPDTATLVQEAPETVHITQVKTETGDTKTVKKTKQILKRKKGPKQEITEITTVQQDDEEPITTVTVTEEDAPEEVTSVEFIELPEEVEETQTPEGKTKKVTKRVLKEKKGPITELTQIVTEQVEDKQPTITVHKTQEITDETVTEFKDTYKPETATLVQEAPETVHITQVKIETGDTKTVKKTKQILKKKKGPKQEITEITTVQQDDEQPITTVTVTEEDAPEEVSSVEFIELPEEVEETKTPEEQVEDKQPTITVHKTQEITDETVTEFKDTYKPDTATLVQEAPETVHITQVKTETGDTKTVKKTKQILKRKKGPKQEITEITTVQQDDEEPITTVTVTEEDAPEQVSSVEFIELPEEVEETKTPEGKPKKVTKRVLKQKKGPITETTQIVTEQVEDKQPTITVHKTQEITDETVTEFKDTYKPDTATLVQEAPETVHITQVKTETVQQDDEQPITTVTVTEEDAPEEVSSVEFIELPEEVKETQTPEGKPKVTKRVLKQKEGHYGNNTNRNRTGGDKQPTITVHKTQEITDETVTEFKDTYKPDTATLVHEAPETVHITQVKTETVQQDDEQPITTVTVTEEDAPEEVSSVEFIELPEEVEETQTPKAQAKITEITTVQQDDEEPITTITVTEEDAPEQVSSVEFIELPEEIEEQRRPKNRWKTNSPLSRVHKTKITDRNSHRIQRHLQPDTATLVQGLLKPYTLLKSKPETGDTKTVKKTKQNTKKKKGLSKITEITTVQQDDEQPITTVTVTEEDAQRRSLIGRVHRLPEEVEKRRRPK